MVVEEIDPLLLFTSSIYVIASLLLKPLRVNTPSVLLISVTDACHPGVYAQPSVSVWLDESDSKSDRVEKATSKSAQSEMFSMYLPAVHDLRVAPPAAAGRNTSQPPLSGTSFKERVGTADRGWWQYLLHHYLLFRARFNFKCSEENFYFEPFPYTSKKANK